MTDEARHISTAWSLKKQREYALKLINDAFDLAEEGDMYPVCEGSIKRPLHVSGVTPGGVLYQEHDGVRKVSLEITLYPKVGIWENK